MRRASAIAWAVFEDGVRRKVMYVVAVFAAVLTAAVPSLPGYGLGVTAALYREVSLALTFAGALVVTLALAVNRLPGEIERRTAYNVLAKPVSRWQYLSGTWMGIALLSCAVVAAFTVCDQAVGFLRYGEPMWGLWEGSFGVWLEMCVISAFAVSASSVTGPVPVTLASLTFLFAAHSRSSFFRDGDLALASKLYPSLDSLNVIDPVSHGSGISIWHAGSMLLVAAGWSACLLLLGAVVFERRDV